MLEKLESRTVFPVVLLSVVLPLVLTSSCKKNENSAPGAKPAGSTSNPSAAEPAAAPAPPPAAPAAAPKTPEKEPDHITVQHILIGFQGSVRGKPITRTKDEAKQLAEDLLKRAKAGEDFDALVKQHTDDSHPGIYKMANRNVAPDQAAGEYPRAGMVPAFGDVGFPLDAGGIGMAEHHPTKSPFGWHIVKRLE
jgi:hypothetical protein